MDPETEAPEVNINVSVEGEQSETEITAEEAEAIATAAETTAAAASAAVALAEVEAARTIADRDAEIEELKAWQATAKLQLEEFSALKNSLPDLIGSILLAQQAQIQEAQTTAETALAEATEEEQPPPNSLEEPTKMEAQQESAEESPALEAGPEKRARKRTFV